MNSIGAVVLGASAVMVAALPPARAQTSEVPTINQATTAPSIPAGTESAMPRSSPLFSIGGVPVYLWAPVAPPYSTNANRNLAADPLTEAGMPTAHSGF
jgi:hypothetical protein